MRRRVLFRVAPYLTVAVAAVYLLLFVHMRFFWKPDLQPFVDLLTQKVNDVGRDAITSSPSPGVQVGPTANPNGAPPKGR